MSPTGYEQAVAEVKGAKPTADIAGETFQLHGRVTTLDVSELARGADLDSGSSEGAALLSEFFRAAFGDHTPKGRREYTRFRRHLRTVEDGDEAMLAGMNACVEAFSGFPTKQPQDFRPPPSRTTRGSKAGGSRRAAPAPEPASTQVVTGELVVDEGEGSEPEAEKPTVVVNLGRRAS